MLVLVKVEPPFLRFNSTLVQLKADPNFSLVAYNSFQFYLSSIKSGCLSRCSAFGLWFQFYLSSIKSIPPGESEANYSCFNSTLVQLKVSLPVLLISRNWSFNSTLVQLKEFFISYVQSVFYWFQFYLSSIKRV